MIPRVLSLADVDAAPTRTPGRAAGPRLRHTFSCALPTRGGVCDCQPGHDPSIDPWPHLPPLRSLPARERRPIGILDSHARSTIDAEGRESA